MAKAPVRPTLDFDTQIAKFTPRQMQAVQAVDSKKTKFILFGGALGGGKSYGLRWLAARLLMEFYARYQLKYVQVMLACEDFPSLKDRQISKIAREFPEWMGQSYLDHKDYGRCFILSPEYGNGVICFRNLDDASKYASAEFAAILVDELTKNDLDTFNFLRTRLRWPGVPDQECVFVAGTNPGGIGHGWVKALWMDKTFPDEFIHPTDYRPQFTYIPSKADDNPYLDASYWSILSTLPETLRKAFRDGDWDTYVGQAFPEFGKNHIIKPTTVPEGARIYMTFDWGYGAPFSLLWWWVDGDGRVYLFNEWYGWNGSPNQGMRLTDPEIGKGILEREDNLKIVHKDVIRLAGPDCFSKKPDYRGGGQGPSTAEVFSSMGIHMSPGDPSRELKIRQFRERLRVLPDSPPMMLVYDSCVQFIRTIPLIQVAKNNPEYLDEDGELHCFDAACHIMMSRPLALAQPKPIKTSAETHIEKQISGKGTDYEDAAGVAALTAWKDVEIGLQRQRGTYSDVDGR